MLPSLLLSGFFYYVSFFFYELDVSDAYDYDLWTRYAMNMTGDIG